MYAETANIPRHGKSEHSYIQIEPHHEKTSAVPLGLTCIHLFETANPHSLKRILFAESFWNIYKVWNRTACILMYLDPCCSQTHYVDFHVAWLNSFLRIKWRFAHSKVWNLRTNDAYAQPYLLVFLLDIYITKLWKNKDFKIKSILRHFGSFSECSLYFFYTNVKS